MPRAPQPSEWEAIQGGPPIIMVSPSDRLVEIIHAYKNGAGEYRGSLAVVPTPREQLMGSTLLHLSLADTQDDVVIRAAFLWNFHGKPCEDRSRDRYPRLRPAEVDAYLQDRLDRGWTQLPAPSSSH